MAVYLYKGIDKFGKEVKGNVTAESLSKGKSKVKQMGVMLTSIKEENIRSKGSSSITFGSKVNISELSLMTRQLATLLKANIPLVQALKALVDQIEHPYLKGVLAEVMQKVNEGASLASAFGDYPKVFNHVYVNMVEAGESSGTLSIVLVRLAEFTEAQVKLKNKVKGAMTYPIIMVIFGSIMMGIIFAFVIPKISKIFISMKKELPWTTKLAMSISDFVVNYWYIVILSVIFGIIFFKKYIQTPKGKSQYDALLLKLPIVGNLTTMINISRFTSTLATLLNSGVPIIQAMNIVKNLVSNVHIQNAVQEARDNISEGASMTGPLVRSGLFPPMVTHMISLGEKSGELEPMLEIIAENYEDQVDSKLSGLTSILEPVMMVGMGLAVAFIVFSVVMPLMDMNKLH